MSDDRSARLSLPYLAAGQMQKHVTLNEALTRLDALVQTAIASRTQIAQPTTPTDGVLYVLPVGATGEDWGARAAGALVRFEQGGWSEVEAPPGVVALVVDGAELVVRDAAGWFPLGRRLRAVQGLERLGIGAEADEANPFSARLNKALWTALETTAGGDGGLRFTLNKQGAPDVLSLLLQSGWGGRAELGLVGDDDFRLKVSADGSVWREALHVDRHTGRIDFALGAGRRETTTFSGDGTYTPPPWARAVEAVLVGGGGGGGAGGAGASGVRPGGEGGGAGGLTFATWPAEQLPETLAVVIGGGGGGGETGAEGGVSSVQIGGVQLAAAQGGRGGAPAAGIDGATDAPDGPGGGGAGGGLDAGGVAQNGRPGRSGGRMAVPAVGGVGGSGSAGGAGTVAPLSTLHWSGGGGGGGGASSSGIGHAGGAGAWAGGGGGGGGAGSTAGGRGGDGSSGIVWLTAIG